MNPEKEAIENIKKFRELKNLTRDELATQLDMSLSGYSKLERGDVELSVKRLYQIATILEISPSQILNFDASQVFNISNNQNVHAGNHSEQQGNFYYDEMAKKYIAVLEAEIERLKAENKR